MPVVIQCPNPACQASYSVADSSSGRSLQCPKCHQSFAVQPTAEGQAGSDTKQIQPSANANPFPVLPAEFGRYRILKQLGRGGMGAVFLAQDTQLKRQVALKVPFFDMAEAPQRAERFVREAQSAAVLHHPNICTVFDAGQIDGRPFITMAYLPGKPLEEAIDPDNPMPQVRAAEIVHKIARALEHAHGQGIVHRDLKPANVMLMASGEPVVMDFGLAKRVVDVDPNEAKLTRLGGILGTPSYMAPEQVKGDVAAIGPATDVYALGVMLFEMLTGRTPYTGPQRVVMGQILAAPIPPVTEFRPDVDSRLDAICRKAMAKNPAERFRSMAELAHILGFFLTAPATSPPPLPSPIAAIVEAPAPVVERPSSAIRAEPHRPLPVPRKATGGRVVVVGVALVLLLGVALALLVPLGGWLAIVVFRGKSTNGNSVVETNDGEGKDRTGPGGKGKADLPKKGDEIINSMGMKFVWIEPGSFLMGSPDGKNPPGIPAEVGRVADETPHRVTLTKGYLMGVTHVTQRQWEDVLGKDANQSSSKDTLNGLPVNNVSWFDCVEFCNALSEKEGRKPCYRVMVIKREQNHIQSADVERLPEGTGYRLPTEAEWEYAYRAGTETAYFFGDDPKILGDYNWYGANAGTSSRPVGTLKPNPWGLHDMGGNLQSWCEDWYGSYGEGDKTDPIGMDKGDKSVRVLRGGSWWRNFDQTTCRAAFRTQGAPAATNSVYGCRVVRCPD